MQELCALTCRCRPVKLHAHLRSLPYAGELSRGRAVRDDLQISHASQDPKDLSRRTFSVSAADFRNLFITDCDLKRRFAGKKRGDIIGSDIGDEVPEAIHFQHYRAYFVFGDGFWFGRGEFDIVLNLVTELVRIDHLCQVRRHRREYIARLKSVADRLVEVVIRSDMP